VGGGAVAWIRIQAHPRLRAFQGKEEGSRKEGAFFG
jgi:hypothetical protein